MNNIVKDIRENCKDLTVEGIVSFLNAKGDFKFTAEYHREIHFFYQECRKMPMTHRVARSTTIQLFKLTAINFKTIMRKFKEDG